jgi:hypothetical protein
LKITLLAGEKVRYKDLIYTAIFNIKDRTGSSLSAIEKYIHKKKMDKSN